MASRTIVIGAALLAALGGASLTCVPVYVPTHSMDPSIGAGQVLLVNKIALGLRLPLTSLKVASWGQVERGDVVVFEGTLDDGSTTWFVKRVAAVGGDSLSMDPQGRLTLNGVPAVYSGAERVVDEGFGGRRHRVRLAHGTTGVAGHWKVPPNHLFVVGDNRGASEDSRRHGPIAVDRVVGVGVLRP